MYKANEFSVEEYDLYNKAKTNPDEINPMVEYSTDWDELDNKYRGLTRKAVEEIVENPKAWDDAGKWISENLLSNEEKSKFDVRG